MLLDQVGIPYRAVESGIEEIGAPPGEPKDVALHWARLKGLAVSERHPNRWVLAADTIVVVDGAILGKPADARDARDMLLRLSGREHMVITAFRIVHMERNVHEKGAVETTVKVKTLEKQDVEGYIRTGEPIGKAGGYAIQGIGAFMVESISGSYTNVVGLPLFEVLETLRALGALRFFA